MKDIKHIKEVVSEKEINDFQKYVKAIKLKWLIIYPKKDIEEKH